MLSINCGYRILELFFRRNIVVILSILIFLSFSVAAFQFHFVQNAQNVKKLSFPPFGCGKLGKIVENFASPLVFAVEMCDVKESY